MDEERKLRFPEWQGEYDAALRETEKVRLFSRIEVAEAAIRLRRDEITKTSDHHAERRAIAKALAALAKLKAGRLGFHKI